jgi:pSer/pThr/pTyr-binding forkhead associated (FHA) protein
MLDFILSGELLRFWLHNYLTIPATAISIVLALVVYKKSGVSASSLVIKGISITSVVATAPLTLYQVGINIAITNLESIALCSMAGTIIAAITGIPYLFVKSSIQFENQGNYKNNQVKQMDTNLDYDSLLNPDKEKRDSLVRDTGNKQVVINNSDENLFLTNISNAVTTIGRSEDNDLVISSDAKVSRHHAKLIRHGDDVVIEDIGSTNGTKVNGSKISSSKIDDSSVIKMGDTVLLGSNLLKGIVNSANPDKPHYDPVIVDSHKKQKNVFGTIDRKKVFKTTSATLTFKNGSKQGDSIPLDNEYIRIGRSSENDIQLTESKVSRNHAVIKKINEKYAIFDSGSTTGTFVNNEKISGKRILVGTIDGSIKVGDTELKLEPFESYEDDEDDYGTSYGTQGNDKKSASANLMIVKGPGSGTVFPITDGVNYIGRGSQNNINLSDPTVSREHCVLVTREHGFDVFELGSRSGTIVNNKFVEPKFLQAQDIVKIGKTEFIFSFFNLG